MIQSVLVGQLDAHFDILRGEGLTIPFRVRDEFSNPVDLTSATEIKVCFLNADGTSLVRTLTASGGVTVVGNALLGQAQVVLTAAQTLELAEGGFRTFEVEVTIGGVPDKAYKKQAYSVLEPSC